MTKKKILIVDDEKALRIILMHNLKINNYECYEAINAEEALEILKNNSDDIFLVITDLIMPKMNGLELIKIAKKLYPSIEMILLTGLGSDKAAVEAFQFGASGYMSKPIDLEELLFIVKKSEEIYCLKSQNINYMKELQEKKEFENEKDLYQTMCFELRKEQMQNEKKISKLYEFIKNNISESQIPEEIKSIGIQKDF